MENLIENGNAKADHRLDDERPQQSEEVGEIMSQNPRWIVRQGITLVFVVSAVLLTVAYFVKYPDVVRGDVTITFSSPPVKLVARSSGKIQQLFFSNNAVAKIDDPICLLENPSSLENILAVKRILKRLDSLMRNSGDITSVAFDTRLNLGDMQSHYIDLYLAYQQYLFLIRERPYHKQIDQYEKNLKYSEGLDEALNTKELLLSEQLMLEQKKFKIDSLLAENSVNSPLEFYNSQFRLLNQTLNAQTIKFSILENRMQQVELKRNILQLNQSLIQAQNDLKYKIFESVRKLDAAIIDWEQKYLLKAPVAGKINFFKFWKENQFVETSEAVAMIIPSSNDYTCKARVPVNGAGKIAPGQKVLIKLKAYPYHEFGVVIGHVISISDIPMDNYYAMEIKLSNGLMTNKKIEIPAYSLAEGEGEVLTNNRSILERIFDRILSIARYNS